MTALAEAEAAGDEYADPAGVGAALNTAAWSCSVVSIIIIIAAVAVAVVVVVVVVVIIMLWMLLFAAARLLCRCYDHTNQIKLNLII